MVHDRVVIEKRRLGFRERHPVFPLVRDVLLLVPFQTASPPRAYNVFIRVLPSSFGCNSGRPHDGRLDLAGPEHVIEYLGRYTHRNGISNHHLVSMDNDAVRFCTKNGRVEDLAPQEFIRRFLLHVLPPRFVKIQHCGLLASSNVNTRLVVARTHTPPDRRGPDALSPVE